MGTQVLINESWYYTLRFVNGSGIAMIDMGIVFQVERDRSTVVEPDRHHFNVVDGLADPDHALTRALLAD